MSDERMEETTVQVECIALLASVGQVNGHKYMKSNVHMCTATGWIP